MESSSRQGKSTEPQVPLPTRQTRSGYEPSDTETDWQDSPLHEHPKKIESHNVVEGLRSRSALSIRRRHTTKLDPERKHSKSPYKHRFDYDHADLHLPPYAKNNTSLPKSDQNKHISPYKTRKQGHGLYVDEQFGSSREKSSHVRRSASAPRPRSRENGVQVKNDHNEPSVGAINEMVANAKISTGQGNNKAMFESTESISPGDIFFSRDYAALKMQKSVFVKNGGAEKRFSGNPETSKNRYHGAYKGNKSSAGFNQPNQGISSSTVLSQSAINSSSGVSRQSSNISDTSARTTASMRQFTANRKKSQSQAWFGCIKKGPCRTSKKSPEKERAFDEAYFIEKAFVVESIRQFWADKHRPTSLDGFTFHKQEALQLKQLVSHKTFPHILLKGPPGSGKKAMTMALLREIYGEHAWNISHDLHQFHIQETRPVNVRVPVSSSPHHVELNVFLEPNSRYAMMALVKQISNEYAVTPEISTASMKADYKVMVLYDVDKSAESVQHLIKWIMDCYSDACKLILCCEDDVDILESVKSRCEFVNLDAPVTHEIMEVLIQVARKEDFELGMSFAAKVATKSKQNVRRAIMALEACKAHNYPFIDDQPIPLGWEEVVMELADEVLADPYPGRLFMIRGKLQKLLQEFVHPKLILLKLVEQFLKRVESGVKRELYYWHAYYDKRLPTGTSSLLKLEEFVAKFMSIYRKSSSNRQFS